MPRFSRPLVVVTILAVLIFLHLLFNKSAHSSHLIISTTSSFTKYQFHIQEKQQISKHLQNTPIRSPSRHSEYPETQDTTIRIDSRGYTTFDPTSSIHPIEALINRAKKQAAIIESQLAEIETVEDAADDYYNAFSMLPPKGFEKWFKFTRRSNPHTPAAPSLIPLVHQPALQYLSIPPDILRERVTEIREKGGMWTFTFVPDGKGDDGLACEADQTWIPKDYHSRGKGRVIVQGPSAYGWRCNNTLTLMLPILSLMPEEMFNQNPPFEMAFDDADGPRGMVHSNFRDKSESLALQGKVWPKAALNQAEQAMRWTYGWQWACPEGSPLKSRNTDLVLNDLIDADEADGSISRKHFVGSFDQSVNFCDNPDLMDLHNVLLNEKHRAAVNLVPAVVTCKVMWNSDIVGVPLDGVWEKVKPIAWEDKAIHKAFWRGSATGLHHSKSTPWRKSQRERLHWFSHNTSDAKHALLVQRDGKLVTEDWSIKELNEKWLDVGLSGRPVQCKEEDGTCDEMAQEIDFMGRVSKEDGAKYRYVVDVDGNGWSSRFRRLLAGTNVVLKSTLFPEWFNEMLIPWYHYVPIKMDYSDIYDVLAFFLGSPDGTTQGRVDLAKEIAGQGVRFTQEKWRTEDMQSFMFLLTLEYWRIMSDDREATSYEM